ncbi:MAG: hypothetical protein NC483_04330 [Ruminococcus sp.]|nr:hypothetical protein [Ruminococcus sp.]
MKIEKLRNGNSKKYFLCGLILVVVLMVIVTFIGSKANYRMTASIPLTEGKVISSPYDFRVVSIYINNGDGNYIEQEKTTLIPSGDYNLNESKSYCYKTNKDSKDNNIKLYTDEINNHVIKGISKGDRCILYFDKNNETSKTMNELLNTHFKYKSKRIVENKDFNLSYEETTYGVMFEAKDDDGTSYYFAGNPLDNWVEFGGYYWRIIRVNGDGSVRMIYQGRTKDESGNKLEPQIKGKETRIGTSQFNNFYTSLVYAGYFYNISEVNGLGTPSIMYAFLNDWFKTSNIKQGTKYYDKIDKNSGFCGDRTLNKSEESTLKDGVNIGDGLGTISSQSQYYGAYIRLVQNNSGTKIITPSLSCNNNLDLYTYASSNKGNKVLENPVGLITADEASYAGLAVGSNNKSENNYLITGNRTWTMTPSWSNSNTALLFSVYEDGSLFSGLGPHGSFSVRPVINLRSDVTFTGDGTQSNPFKVVMS